MGFKSPDGTVLSDFVIWILFFLAGFIILSLYADTLQLTYDSHSYIKASENAEIYFYGKNELGIPYLFRPPVLPVYLYFFDNKVLACWWLNVFSYATSLFLCYKIGYSLNLRGWYLYGSLVLIAFNYPWLQNHFFLWSEPLFSVFILLLAYSLITDKHVGVVVTICIVAFLLRKAGLFLSIGAVACYLMRRDYKSAVLAGFATIFVFIGWEILSFRLSQVSTSAAIYNYMRELSRIHYVDAISSWAFPRVIPLNVRIVLTVSAIVIICLAFKDSVHAFFNKRVNQTILVIVLVYFACFIVPIGVPDYHEGERYLSVMIPLTLIIIFSFWSEINFINHLKQKLFLMLMVVWSLYPLGRTVYHFFSSAILDIKGL